MATDQFVVPDQAVGCDEHKLKEQKDAADLVLDASAKNAKVDRDIVLQILPTPLAGKEKKAAPRFAISSTNSFQIRFADTLIPFGASGIVAEYFGSLGSGRCARQPSARRVFDGLGAGPDI